MTASFPNRVERLVRVAAHPRFVFERLDDHRILAAHMERRSWRMGFGRVRLTVRESEPPGRTTLSWRGSAFGLPIAVEEVVTERRSPQYKRWETVGPQRMWVLDAYRMGFWLAPHDSGCTVRLEIEYRLPDKGVERVLGRWLGHAYARSCLDRMIGDLRSAFGTLGSVAAPAAR